MRRGEGAGERKKSEFNSWEWVCQPTPIERGEIEFFVPRVVAGPVRQGEGGGGGNSKSEEDENFDR